MIATLMLYSKKKEQLNKFLSLFYNTNLQLGDSLKWEKKYQNPLELAEIIGTFIDNFDDYFLDMWICLDKDIFINITKENGNDIIKYLYERFPY